MLRRERFFFDSLLAGTKALQRLHTVLRTHTRHAILTGMNLTCIATGCGESNAQDVEPPVMLALGSAGGTGIVSALLEEIFRFTSSRPVYGSERQLSSASLGDFAATNLAAQRRLSRVCLSAVLVCRHRVLDLLNSASSSESTPSIAVDSKQRAVLKSATWVDLQSAMDFERIVGLLLGRRTGLLEAMQQQQQQQQQQQAYSNPYATWDSASMAAGSSATSQSSSRMLSADKLGTLGAVPVDEAPSTVLMVSVAVTCSMVSSKAQQLMFRVVCPCGQNWTQPGFDLNALAEVLSSLPHASPASILQASPLTALLTDRQHQRCTSYLSMLAIQRRRGDRGGGGDGGGLGAELDWELAATALQVLRLASLPK
jgi:hypothetical protein